MESLHPPIAPAALLGLLTSKDDRFKSANVVPIDSGEFCDAWSLDDTWIVRAGRHSRADAALRMECRLMPRLAPRLSLSVPIPELVVDDPETGRVIAVHVWIGGRSLTPEIFARMDSRSQLAATSALASFLDEMRHAPSSELADCRLRTERPLVDYAKARDSIEALVFAEGDRQLGPACVAMLEHLPPLGPELLLHNDLSPEHILVDDQGTVIGIIDFGDASLGPASFDLRYLYEDYPPTFLRQVLRGNAIGEAEQHIRLARLWSVWGTLCWLVDNAGSARHRSPEWYSALADLRHSVLGAQA